jgi:hypothetical protein
MIYVVDYSVKPFGKVSARFIYINKSSKSNLKDSFYRRGVRKLREWKGCGGKRKRGEEKGKLREGQR